MSRSRNRTKTKTSRDSENDDQDSFDCPHMGDVDTLVANKSILSPTAWLCKTCQSPESVWACLSCGHMGYVPTIIEENKLQFILCYLYLMITVTKTDVVMILKDMHETIQIKNGIIHWQLILIHMLSITEGFFYC